MTLQGSMAYINCQLSVLTRSAAICLEHLPLATHFLDTAMIHLFQAQQQGFLRSNTIKLCTMFTDITPMCSSVDTALVMSQFKLLNLVAEKLHEMAMHLIRPISNWLLGHGWGCNTPLQDSSASDTQST